MGPARRFDLLALSVVLGLAAAIGALVVLGKSRPLGVIEVSPPDGATGVPATAQVRVTFSRPVDEASVRDGLTVDPPVEGFVSVAGRRAAFTPRAAFRPDTGYTVRLSPGIRDRGGQGLGQPVALRFRTRPLELVIRSRDGSLVRWRLGGEPQRLAEPRVGEFAVGPEGGVAYERPEERMLVVLSAEGAPLRRITLPSDLDIRQLEWGGAGSALFLLGARGGGLGTPYLVRLETAAPAVEPFGPGASRVDPTSALLTEALKQALVEIVYRSESFAVSPDGHSAIVRDRSWDFALIGLDGSRLASIGPFLTVGNVAPRGDALAVVDVNPADPLLRRQVLVYRTGGETRPISSPDHDSHSPRFAHRSDRVVFTTGLPEGPPAARRFALEVVDLATGARQPLTDPPPGESDEAPHWSPDGRWISFRRAPVGAPERGTVWLVPADGGPASPLPVPATEARWSP